MKYDLKILFIGLPIVLETDLLVIKPGLGLRKIGNG
jgi:hypothetical protein